MSNHWCTICGNVCKSYTMYEGVRISSDHCCVCKELYDDEVVKKVCKACQKRINAILQRVDDKYAYQQLLASKDREVEWRLI